MTTGRVAYYLLLIAMLMPSIPNGPDASSARLDTAEIANPGYHERCGGEAPVCAATAYLLERLEAKARTSFMILTNWQNAADWTTSDYRA